MDQQSFSTHARWGLWSLSLGLLMIAVAPQRAAANWGGSSFGNTELGDFQTTGTSQVEMQKERLWISLMMEHAEVKVDYVLHNTGDAVTVRAGFPGEQFIPDYEEAGDDTAYDRDIVDYKITVDGESLPWKNEERMASKHERPAPDGIGDFSSSVAYWLVSDLSFSPDQTRNVSISYRARYPFFQGGASDDTTYQKAEFVYRLSTGAMWKGSISKGEVVIEAPGVDLSEWTQDKRFVRQNKVWVWRFENKTWVWRFENLEPTAKSDIRIPVRDEYSQYAVWGEGVTGFGVTGFYEIRNGKWTFIHTDYEATATSVLDKVKYSPNNVREYRDMAWCEGVSGPGIGERLTLTLREAKPISTIGIMPGYHKTEKIYKSNNRVARMKIQVDDNKPFEVQFLDEFLRESEFRIPTGTDKPVRRVMLEIMEVFKGRKHADTCIGRVRLFQPLPRAPEHYGSR